MMALAPHLGRQEAHDVVYDACRVAAESGRSLGEVLGSLPAVTAHLSAHEIAEAVDPVRYLGAAQEMVDRLLRGR
jgi:3-carboxy-cis,cis-muconate cycloisomerase